MTTWTPATPYAPGDVALGPPALVEPDFTWPEQLTKAATLLLVVATGIVIVPHILTFQPLADSRQIGAGIGLIFAAMLFDFGIDQVLDWRRERRARVLPCGWKVETEYSSLQDAIAAGWLDVWAGEAVHGLSTWTAEALVDGLTAESDHLDGRDPEDLLPHVKSWMESRKA